MTLDSCEELGLNISFYITLVVISYREVSSNSSNDKANVYAINFAAVAKETGP